MRRWTVIVPGCLAAPDDESVLGQNLPGLARLAEIGEVGGVLPVPLVETPEALLLGMGPGEGQLRQGPLTVSALGADPPQRSTQFHVSVLSVCDGVVGAAEFLPSDEDAREIVRLAERLNTKSLTFIPGEKLDHGLVWEALGDMETTAAAAAVGRAMRECLPEGDGERVLRRFIDDGVNLLSETEWNDRREEEGMARLNLLWPWGQGVRMPVPNLALRRGSPCWVWSDSMRMAGLARLCGYRHAVLGGLGHGLNLNVRGLCAELGSRDCALAVIDGFSDWRAAGQVDEAAWMMKELDGALISPLLELAREGSAHVSLILTGALGGVCGTCFLGARGGGSAPLDERALEEPRLERKTIWERVEESLVEAGIAEERSAGAGPGV